MPSKITQNTTSSATGEISIADLFKIIGDYQSLVTVSSSDPNRNPVSKYFHFDIEMSLVQAILANPAADKQRFRIHLALNLPGQRSCDGSRSIENYLSIMISGLDAATPGTALLNVGDLVLADGFREYNGGQQQLVSRCCVQGGNHTQDRTQL